MKLRSVLLMGIVGVMMGGCAHMFKYRPYARNVKKLPGKSGVVALKTVHQKEDQDLAQSIMAQNCGGKKVVVVEEGEVSIGTVTQAVTSGSAAPSKNVGSIFGLPVSTGGTRSSEMSSTTVQKKEWQIKYKCR